VKVKICGLTRREDVEVAVSLGATHVGCVLVPGTPRDVSAAQARELLTGSRAEPVLVFRDPSQGLVNDAVSVTGIRRVQLHHYREPVASRLESLGMQVHRVVEARDQECCRAAAIIARPDAPVHLDVEGGGSGRTFDWAMLGGLPLEDVFIAGGLSPDNVSGLLPFGPGGVDVSSGVESSPGRKDPAKLRLLFERLRPGGDA